MLHTLNICLNKIERNLKWRRIISGIWVTAKSKAKNNLLFLAFDYFELLNSNATYCDAFIAPESLK